MLGWREALIYSHCNIQCEANRTIFRKTMIEQNLPVE